ncbi:hypothetical protein Tco_0884936 [Tanacetum coccineum]
MNTDNKSVIRAYSKKAADSAVSTDMSNSSDIVLFKSALEGTSIRNCATGRWPGQLAVVVVVDVEIAVAETGGAARSSLLAFIKSVQKKLPPSSGIPAGLDRFRRIFLTGFRSCTSRSYYWNLSKQTARISIFIVNDITQMFWKNHKDNAKDS